MDSLLSVKPGLVFWTLVNFGIFLFLGLKFGLGAILKGLKDRENNIQENISSAQKANQEATALLREAQAKIDNAQQEMADIITKGKAQADEYIRKSSEEAERVKRQKVEEAAKEIERSKNSALKELRTEVAKLVVEATEKILVEKLDSNKDQQLIESYIDKLSKN